jgi:hypothetical protein
LLTLEIDKIRRCVHEIVSNLNKDNIEKYIVKLDEDPNAPFEKNFNDHFPAFKKAEEYIIHLQNLRYTKPEEVKEIKEVKNEILNSNDEMLEFIKSTKAKLLQKILNYEKTNII